MPATTDFLPSRESDLVVWSTTFNGLIVATPTAYGLVAAQATAYTALQTAFVTAFNLANGDATRTPAGLVTKDTAKVALIANARQLAGIIQRDPDTTNTQRSALGLTIKASPSPIPAPSEAPNIDILDRVGTSVELKLHDGSGSRRGRPAGVQGASVFSYVGATPPVSTSGFKFEGNTTRTKFTVEFDAALPPGTKVWFTAFWFNPRSQSGPGCTPISAILAGGGMSMAA